MNFQSKWKKAKKVLAFVLAFALFFGGWGNYDFSVLAANELIVKLTAESAVYTGSEIALPEISSVKDGNADVTSYETSTWTDENGKGVNGAVTEAGVYTLKVMETVTETVTDPDTGVETEETKETGRDGIATFTVEKLDISKCTVILEKDSETYTGEALEPKVTVTAENTVVDAKLYTVEYTDNTNAGTAKVIVTPVASNQNIVGSNEKEFTIKAKALTDAMIKITPTEATVTGDNFKDNVKVVVEDTINETKVTLNKGTDYEVEIPDMVKGNSYEIRVLGKGNYAGTISTFFNLYYAQDGTANLGDNTLAEAVYADSVKVTPASGYTISETVDGPFVDSIEYKEKPDDYIVYLQNKDGEITEYKLEEFDIDNDMPTLEVEGPAEDSDWAPSKDIKVSATGADYGVFYTTTKQELVNPIKKAPEGMTKLDAEQTTLTIENTISETTVYYFYAIDKAGHVSTAEATVNKIEAEKPEISIGGNEEKLADGVYWKNADDLVFTVNIKDQENLSGLKEVMATDSADHAVSGLVCEFTERAVDAEGTFTIKEPGVYTLKVKDVAGNISESITIEVKEDTLAPEVILAEPIGTNLYERNGEYWFSANAVELPLEIVDDFGTDESEKAPYTVIYAKDNNFTSPVEVKVIEKAATVPVELTAGKEGKTTYYFKITDKAGNEGTVQQITVGYDNTQPKITEAVLTQLKPDGKDEWINLEESGASQPNETKVTFAVTASDDESGVKKIQYRSSINDEWKDANATESNGVYTFETNETYADGNKYVWEVRMANNVTPNMDDAAVKAVQGGQIDTTAPNRVAYIRFISDVKGANESFTEESGQWLSEIFEMAASTWKKIWGKEAVKFEVYVQDVTSGIDSIEMSYNGIKITGLKTVNGVQAVTTADGVEIGEKDSYIIYEGSITHAIDDELAVKNFRIDTLTDKAGNTTKDIVLGNAENEDIIYLDNVAPRLMSVQIDNADVVAEAKYLYKEQQTIVLKIEERFFAEENTPVYPMVELYSKESGVSTFGEPIKDANISWTKDGVGVIELPLEPGKEMEYQVKMTYSDPSGNSLEPDGKLKLGVENGIFTSKIFLIDDVAPELVDYTVNEPTQYTIDGAAVYKNESSEDLEGIFVIDDNPDDYEIAKENLKVTLFKNNEIVEDEEFVVELLGAKNPNNPREYTYSFRYDGYENTEDVFCVTVEYQDALGHPLADKENKITTGTMDDTGVFTSKNYVIDHVEPKLVKVQIDGQSVVTRDRYFYAGTQNFVVTVDEKFFGKEDGKSVYPVYTLDKISVDDQGTVSNVTSIVATDEKDWVESGNEYTLTIPLEAAKGYEVEYQISFAYADAAGNVLVNGEGIDGVDETGKFESKIFVIDQLAPELVGYSVKTTECDVEQASVLLNKTEKNTTEENKNDLVVNVTVNDNPTYYENNGVNNNHVMSKSNMMIHLYKEDGTLIDVLHHDGTRLTSANNNVTIPQKDSVKIEGRNHSYTFYYDGETSTEDKFFVTVEYKDVVEHSMVDGRSEKVDRADGTADIVTVDSETAKGVYTSEMYIIDHVAPKFSITYSDATNVVQGTRYHDASKLVDDGKSPLKMNTAYYNKDIDVTFTFDEKYVNVVKDGNLVDCEDNSKSPLDHFSFEIKKNGTVLKDDEIPEMTWSHNGTVHTAAFTIEALKNHVNDGDYQFVVTYQDCAENSMDVTAADNSNESTAANKAKGIYTSPILVMDTTAPVLEKVEYDTAKLFNTVKGRDYVSEDTTMTFTLKEHNPTPTSEYSITSKNQKDNKSGKVSWDPIGDVSTTKILVEMSGAYGDEQKTELTIVDWAGNVAKLKDESVLRSSNTEFDKTKGTFTDKFTVDTVVPEIKLEYVTYSPNRPNVEGIDYFKNPITVKVTVDEHNFDKDLFKQSVVKTDGDIAYEESEWTNSGDIHVKTFTFSEDNQYDLSIIGTDNAKNKLHLNDTFDMAETLDEKNSKVSLSVAVDSTIPAIGDTVKPIIVIKPETPQNTTLDGQALYNTDVTYEVVVYDPLLNNYASGINDITFKVTGEDGTSATCDVNKQGDIENTDGTGVTVKQIAGDVKELARGVDNKYTFNVTISSTVFNTNGIVLWVGANDVATTHNEKEVEPIAIDITKPKVVVSYDNNDVSNEKYFHDVRIATVTVTERNFSNDCLKFIVNGSDKSLEFSLSNAGSGNRDNAVWIAHYTFGADQDYTVDVEVQDHAKNEGAADYVGEAPQKFTIDMIKPKMSVEYDNNSVLNDIYYKETRTATITIEERNFDAGDVVIELTAKDGGSVINTPGVSPWSSAGDYHRATIQYDYDGEFTFDIDFMDLATNEADDYEMDHFIVDLTAPELEIFDIEDRSANNDVVAPGVRYSDTNYDADGTVVEMIGYKNGLVEMTGSRVVSGNGVEFKLKDFERVPEMDDVYTMNATVYDLAGNSSEASAMFSVNRFGSVYTFDEKTDALVGENGSYYTNKEQELVVIETNVDTLEFKEITLNLNGKLKTLAEGTDFTVSESGSEESWKQYTYQIAKENFVEEGLYILTIYSEDRATNVSDNNVKGKKIEFIVDKTQPSLLITGVEDGGRYNEDSREVTIDVDDNVSLGYVEVTLNGETTKYSAPEVAEMNGRIKLTVGSSNQYQTLNVAVGDAAENDPVTQEVTFLITANIFVQFYMNKPLFFGSIGSVAGLGGLWWFLIGKKKRNKEEKAQ